MHVRNSLILKMYRLIKFKIWVFLIQRKLKIDDGSFSVTATKTKLKFLYPTGVSNDVRESIFWQLALFFYTAG